MGLWGMATSCCSWACCTADVIIIIVLAVIGDVWQVSVPVAWAHQVCLLVQFSAVRDIARDKLASLEDQARKCEVDEAKDESGKNVDREKDAEEATGQAEVDHDEEGWEHDYRHEGANNALANARVVDLSMRPLEVLSIAKNA